MILLIASAALIMSFEVSHILISNPQPRELLTSPSPRARVASAAKEYYVSEQYDYLARESLSERPSRPRGYLCEMVFPLCKYS